MTLRCPTPFEVPPLDDLADDLEQALSNDQWRAAGHLLLVPDVLVVEWTANGHEPPETVRYVSDDGRSVSIFFVMDGE